jgi:hypothetical protein
MFLYAQSNSLPSTATGEPRSGGLFKYAARHNGPLVDYHPQMLLQCLLWGTYEEMHIRNRELTDGLTGWDI